MTNGTWLVTVPVTWLHCQTLFIIRLELTQGRLHCTLTLTQRTSVKQKKTSFRSTHGSFPVFFSISAVDIRRYSCLGSSPLEFLADGGLFSAFGVRHWAQTAHIPTAVQCLLCEWTLGSGHISTWQVSTFKKNKIKVIFFANPEDGSSKGTEEQRLTGNRLSLSLQLLYLLPAPWLTSKKMLKTNEICWGPLKE